MATSRRQAILTVLAERVSAIQIVNGFQTDAGVVVFLGEAPPLGPDDPDAAIAIVIGEEDPRYQGVQVFLRLPYEIQAHAKADLAQPWLTVERVIADIKKAVELPDRSLGRLLSSVLERGRVRAMPREPGGTTVGASVEYIAPFCEVWGDP